MSLKQRKAAKKKEEILKSAISIISKKGYHATTLDDIAAKLLMTKGSIYYYFKDKQELLFHSQIMIAEQSIENISLIYKQNLPVTEKLKKAIAVHVEYAIKERAGFETMIKPEQILSNEQLEIILERREKYSEKFDQLIADGINQEIFANLEVKIVRNLMLGSMNWVMHWYSADGKKNKEELSQLIADYLFRMLIK